MNLRRLFSRCLFRHQEPLWEGNAMRCLECGTVIPVLPQATVRGPKAAPDEVRGQPKLKAQSVKPAKLVRAEGRFK